MTRLQWILFRTPGRDDAEVVSNAMKWYKEHKDDLIVNLDYGYNSLKAGIERYGEHPLFIKKSASNSMPPRL